MTTILVPTAEPPTFADLLHDLGDVPADRVWLYPLPGTGTEQDVLDADDHQDRLCELIDGVLVEKAMGASESLLAMAIGKIISDFVDAHNLGVVLGEAGMLRLRAGLVRIPDVSFISRENLPSGKIPKDAAIWAIPPTLAVEVLSKSNPPGEMARKRREYFAAGTKAVWEFNPKTRSVKVFTSPTASKTYSRRQTLDGAPVLKGLKISLSQLFARLD